MHPMNSAFFQTFALLAYAENSPEWGSLEPSQIVYGSIKKFINKLWILIF